MQWGPGSVSRYLLLPLWQQKYYDQQNIGVAIAHLTPLLRGQLLNKRAAEAAIFFFAFARN